ADAEDCDNLRLVTLHLRRQFPGTGHQFLFCDFRSRSRSAANEVRNPITEAEHVGLLRRFEQPPRETSRVESGPETIARPSEMLARVSGIEARVDAAKQNAQLRSNHIGDAPASNR